eukprot:tig00020904_g15232.t1
MLVSNSRSRSGSYDGSGSGSADQEYASVDIGRDHDQPQPNVSLPNLEEENRPEFPIPDSLRAVAVLSQLDRVPPVPTLVLKLCSALGPRFEAGLIMFAVEGAVPWRSAAASIQVLERHGLLSRVTVPGGLHEYLFTQPAHAEVLRTVISKTDLGIIAGRCAKYLARTALRRNKAIAQSIARHYSAAGAAEAASPYLDVAIAVAIEEGRYQDACDNADEALAASYGKSLQTLTPLSPRGATASASEDAGWATATARRWQLHARACYALGRATQALHSAEQCLRILGHPTAEDEPPSTLAVLASLLRAALTRPKLRIARARLNEWGDRDSLESALAENSAPDADARSLILVRALCVYVPLLRHAGDSSSAAFYAVRMLKAAERFQYRHQLDFAEAFAVASASLFSMGLGGARAAERMLALSTTAAAAACRVSGACIAAQVTADVLSARFREADSAARSESSRLRSTGDMRALGEVLAVQGASHLLRGNEAEAERLFHALTRQARRDGNGQQLLWGLVGLASAHLQLLHKRHVKTLGSVNVGAAASSAVAAAATNPDPDRLRSTSNLTSMLREARAAFAEDRFPLEAILVASAFARVHLAEGRLEEAEAEAMAGVEALRRHARRRVPAGARIPHLALALVPLCLLADALADLLAGGYSERFAVQAVRRKASRRSLAYGGPLLSSFAERHLKAVAADYGETEAGWARCLRGALRDVLDALAAGAARSAAAAATSALYEGRWQALSGSPRRAQAQFERAFALARASGVLSIAERASELGKLGPGRVAIDIEVGGGESSKGPLQSGTAEPSGFAGPVEGRAIELEAAGKWVQDPDPDPDPEARPASPSDLGVGPLAPVVFSLSTGSKSPDMSPISTAMSPAGADSSNWPSPKKAARS